MVELDPVSSDPSQLRRVFGCFPSGVVAVCAMTGGAPLGMAASAFTCVSLEPGLVSVCVRAESATWPQLRRAGRLGISVLADHHADACRSLASRTGDRFADVDWTTGAGGAVLVHGAVAWLECAIHHEVPAGDHTLVLLEIHAFRAEPDRPPLVFHGSRYGRVQTGREGYSAFSGRGHPELAEGVSRTLNQGEPDNARARARSE